MKRIKNRDGLGEAGFTLIELTFVAALFLLMAAMATSSFRRSYVALSQDLVVHDMLDLMAFARQRAIMERVDYGIQMAPEQNAFWLVRDEGSEESSSWQRIEGTWGRLRRFPNGVEMKDSQTVVFYPDGTATQSVLQLVTGQTRVIVQIDPVTGKGYVKS